MPQSDFGPVNMTQGNSAKFLLEFTDSNGNVTVPSSANLTVTYINSANAQQVDTVTLSLTGSFWTGTWSSTSASYGLANWSLTGSGSSIVAQNGSIRVIDP